MIDLLGTPREALARALAPHGLGPEAIARVFRDAHAGVDVAALGRRTHAFAHELHVARADVTTAQADEDGTHKLLVTLADGARVECVLVPMRGGRTTLCVSTQVGCAMACAFCATGTLGLTRSLTAGEIVAQVHAARAWARVNGRHVGRLVFMGMGEPLHAYESTRDAVRVLLDDCGAGFSTKSIVVSTVGLVARMKQFAEDFDGRVGLALSLHAGTDETRRQIIPTSRTTPIAELKETLRSLPLPGSRYHMLEYVVLPGVNDDDDNVAGLVDFVSGLDAVVNLIPFNPFPSAPFRSPTDDEVWALHGKLRARQVPAWIRWPRGRGAAGACGQLALREADTTA